MNGSSLKRKQPEQIAAGSAGTDPAGQQPTAAQGSQAAPLPAQQKQVQLHKKHKPPHLDGGMEDRQQRITQQEQQQPQREPAHQQQAPQAASMQQQLEPPPPPPLQERERELEQAAVSGFRAEQRAGAAPTAPQHPPQRAPAAMLPAAVPRAAPMRHQGQVPQQQQQTAQQHQAMQPPRQPAQQQQPGMQPQQPLIQQQPAQPLPQMQPLGLPPAQAVPWQQPPAVWPSAAALLGWTQPQPQLWEQQHVQHPQHAQHPQQVLPVWEPSIRPAWDPALQQWSTVPAAERALAQQAQQQQLPSSAAAAPRTHPGLGWQAQAQAAALQQQLRVQQQGVQQQGVQPPDQPQAHGQGQFATKLQRDVPPGGPAEALLRLAVRICCQRLGLGEHDGKQLGKVLEELDRNWRTSTCSGHSVTVLLKELDRRGLVVAREDTSGGKRICYFRNIAC